MTASDDLLVREDDGVLVLALRRPEHRNALTQEIQAQCLEGESAKLMQMRDIDDYKEAARAFAEKGTPGFTGR